MGNIPLFGGIEVADTPDLRRRLTLDNPLWAQAHLWGGANVERTIVGWHSLPQGTLMIPAGCQDTIPGIRPMATHNMVPAQLETSDLACPTPRPYQTPAIEAAMLAERGIIVMPPGAGKTVTALALVRQRGLRPLILVHTKDLMVQWMEAAIQHLGGILLPIGGGQVHRPTDRPYPIIGTVAMLQMLATMRPLDVAYLASQHGMLIMDEAHHAPATTFFQMLWVLPGRFRYALTATPKRADGLTPLLHWAFGRILYEVRVADLEDAGVAVRVQIKRVDTAFEYPMKRRVTISRTGGGFRVRMKHVNWDSIVHLVRDGRRVEVSGLTDPEANGLVRRCSAEGWSTTNMVDTTSLAACYRALCEDFARLDLVLDLTQRMVAEGRTVLVLANRITYAGTITERLVALGIKALCLTSQKSSKKRKSGLDDLRSGTAQVVVATTLADEGLDVPNLSGMIMAFPSRSEARTTQRFGRLMRYVPGKPTPLVYDIVDSHIGLFQNQWVTRRRVYKKAGCVLVG